MPFNILRIIKNSKDIHSSIGARLHASNLSSNIDISRTVIELLMLSILLKNPSLSLEILFSISYTFDWKNENKRNIFHILINNILFHIIDSYWNLEEMLWEEHLFSMYFKLQQQKPKLIMFDNNMLNFFSCNYCFRNSKWYHNNQKKNGRKLCYSSNACLDLTLNNIFFIMCKYELWLTRSYYIINLGKLVMMN